MRPNLAALCNFHRCLWIFLSYHWARKLVRSQNRLCQGTVHLWGSKYAPLLYYVNPIKHYLWFKKKKKKWCCLLKACTVFRVGSKFSNYDFLSVSHKFVCYLSTVMQSITTRMKVSFTSERKRKMWLFSWCTSRSAFIQKIPATDLFEKLSFLLQWNIKVNFQSEMTFLNKK